MRGGAMTNEASTRPNLTHFSSAGELRHHLFFTISWTIIQGWYFCFRIDYLHPCFEQVSKCGTPPTAPVPPSPSPAQEKQWWRRSRLWGLDQPLIFRSADKYLLLLNRPLTNFEQTFDKFWTDFLQIAEWLNFRTPWQAFTPPIMGAALSGDSFEKQLRSQ